MTLIFRNTLQRGRSERRGWYGKKFLNESVTGICFRSYSYSYPYPYSYYCSRYRFSSSSNSQINNSSTTNQSSPSSSSPSNQNISSESLSSSLLSSSSSSSSSTTPFSNQIITETKKNINSSISKSGLSSSNGKVNNKNNNMMTSTSTSTSVDKSGQAEIGITSSPPIISQLWRKLEQMGWLKSNTSNTQELSILRAQMLKLQKQIKRPLASAETVKARFGTVKSTTREMNYAETEKYFKHRYGSGRHWLVEKWHGIPVRYMLLFYLLFAFIMLYRGLLYMNMPTQIDSHKHDNKPKYIHLRYVIRKLNENPEVRKYIGQIEGVKMSKLTRQNKKDQNTKYTVEMWSGSTGGDPDFDITKYSMKNKEGTINDPDSNTNKRSFRKKNKKKRLDDVRIVLYYGATKSLEHLHRIDIELDDDIISLKPLEPDLSEFEVILCPTELIPMFEWFKQSKRNRVLDYLRYAFIIPPLIALGFMARVYFKSPVGLTVYIQDSLKNHVVVKRALGPPISLQSDGWKGKLTSRSCNMKVLLQGSKTTGTVHVVGYRDGSTRWLFPNCVLMIDDMKHDYYREIQLAPFTIKKRDAS